MENEQVAGARPRGEAGGRQFGCKLRAGGGPARPEPVRWPNFAGPGHLPA